MHMVHVREGSEASGEEAGLAVIAIFLSVRGCGLSKDVALPQTGLLIPAI